MSRFQPKTFDTCTVFLGITVILTSIVGILGLFVGALLHDAGQITKDQVFIAPLICIAIGLIAWILGWARENGRG